MTIHIHIHKKTLDAAPHQPGDKIRVKSSRTSGSHAYNIVVEQHVRGNTYRGQILSGSNAGMTVVGEKIGPTTDSTKEEVYTSLYQMEKAVQKMKIKGWFVISHVKQPDGTFNVKYQQGAGTR